MRSNNLTINEEDSVISETTHNLKSVHGIVDKKTGNSIHTKPTRLKSF